MDTTENIAKDSIKKILEHESENLQDAILSCLTNLNLLTTCTPDELDMMKEEMEISKQKEKSVTDDFISTKERIDYWLGELNKNETDFDVQKELILQEFDWIKYKLKINL